ncbi:MAG: LysR family transcriptional regulator [Bifidobacteriaceae bacterium]|jgi:DNA-binding transcriptional LysR family regulator|nr:LysR family transcriptional regulator [Bifidobacteriaceae bacterium]
MDLLQLRYFKAAAAHEHMSHAANELNISQPTLSKAISRLESDLGVELFDRLGRSVELNEFGRLFLTRASRALLELSDGARELGELKERKRQTVGVAINIPSLLGPLLEGFWSRRRGASVRSEIGSTSTMRRHLEDGRVDFCISSPPVAGPSIRCYGLIWEDISLIVPKAHRAAGRSSVDLGEFRSEPFLMFKNDHGIRDLAISMCRRAGFEPRVAFEGGVTSPLAHLVNLGLGVALVPAPHPWGSWEPNAPAYVRVANPASRRQVGLSMVKDRPLTPAAEDFREFVCDQFVQYCGARSHRGD